MVRLDLGEPVAERTIPTVARNKRGTFVSISNPVDLDWAEWSGNVVPIGFSGHDHLEEHEINDANISGMSERRIYIPFKPIFWQELGPLQRARALIEDLRTSRRQRNSLNLSVVGVISDSSSKNVSLNDYLKSIPILHSLYDGDLQKLTYPSSIINVHNDVAVINTGDESSHVFVILSGGVVVNDDSAAASTSSFTLTRGDYFGTFSLFGDVATSTYTATGSLSLLVIPFDVLEEHAEREKVRFEALAAYGCFEGGLSLPSEAAALEPEVSSLFALAEQIIDVISVFKVPRHVSDLFDSINN